MSRQMTTSAFHNSKTLDNKYMLGDEIGKGAYGRVYKGLDLQNGDFVAIKQVSLSNIAQEDLNTIMQEIDLLKNLNHKNIVKYLGSLKTKTHLHIILEYVENGSLANIIKPNKFGPFPESLVAVYIAQVLEGLVYLHEQGVIHRDIKGANILTTKEGLVKLADFGVATKLTEADVNTHSVVGTPYWMAPEVLLREMVHIAIDGMWQIFKLQRSTSRNDFCRIAAKNGILLRLINTLYSLNEATRLASIASGSGFPADGLAPRPRSGPLDSSSPSFVQTDTPFYGIDQPDHLKIKQGDHVSLPGVQEPSQTSVSHSPDSRFFAPDADRPQSSMVNVEASGTSKLLDPAGLDKGTNAASKRESRADVELKQQRGSNAGSIASSDRPPKFVEGASNGFSSATQQENVRPLLSLLDKEPPSRHFSGQLEYVRHLTGLEKPETILPLLHASGDKKTNGLDFLMAEFAEVSGRGRENSNMDSLPRTSPKTTNMKLGSLTSNGGIASTSGLASQTASGVLSGSGVLNARPGSATSSGLLSHMVSSWNVDVAREYLEKLADLLLEFAAADTTVKSYMCSQSLLTRLFQMFNKIEPPILLKLLKCLHHLSTDPHCLENLQRADAIKYLIPNLDLKEGALVSQIHHEVLHALFNLCKINKRRQEQAAENGIIPHLMQFIMSDSPLKQYALPLLCDMAHASRNSREQLRAHGGLDVYLSLLEDEFWSGTALDSIAVCLAHDNENKKVEQALLKKDAIQKLVKFFQCCPEQHFLHILEPFLKIITYVVLLIPFDRKYSYDLDIISLPLVLHSANR
ncbi:MAP3K epsilon protein kinase 1-like [Olea europaea var. sylvestris]|uniref:MAP3K epsilon protein kinase 1-like n=1 Tax=Olea europaea var. sylvestris TaxID=158386 RepID=UPI000C1CE1DD|nr:MAP3K epsilon protein kinase 1-like [Olea europaea var. sylvestris]